MELKGKREVFCREYLKDLCAGKAAERAGYSRDRSYTTGSELLATEEVQQRIAELAQARNEKFEIEARDILMRLAHIATLDPIVTVDEDGAPKSLHDMPEAARLAITGYTTEQVGSAKTVLRTTVKFEKRLDALFHLGKHLTLFKEVIAVEGLGDLMSKIVEARKRDPESAEALV